MYMYYTCTYIYLYMYIHAHVYVFLILVIQTIKAFAPDMISKNHGHIITIASGAGLFGISGLVDYCASKFGAVGTHQSLSMELDALGCRGVHTTCVCPYFIDTGMFDGVQTRLAGREGRREGGREGSEKEGGGREGGKEIRQRERERERERDKERKRQREK